MCFAPHAPAHLHAVKCTDSSLMRHYIPRDYHACAPDVLTARRPTVFTPLHWVAYYRMADVAMVTSLHDGMNLGGERVCRVAGRAVRGVDRQRVHWGCRSPGRRLAHQPARYGGRGRYPQTRHRDVPRGKGSPHGPTAHAPCRA